MEERRKFRVPLKIAVLIAVLALLVAGCGQPAAPASEEMAEEPAEETTSVEGVMDVPREQTLIVGWWGSDEFEESEIYTPFAIGGDYQRGLNVIYEGMGLTGMPSATRRSCGRPRASTTMTTIPS